MPADMDLLKAWGSMSDMATLQQRAGDFAPDAEPLQVRARPRPWGHHYNKAICGI